MLAEADLEGKLNVKLAKLLFYIDRVKRLRSAKLNFLLCIKQKKKNTGKPEL